MKVGMYGMALDVRHDVLGYVEFFLWNGLSESWHTSIQRLPQVIAMFSTLALEVNRTVEIDQKTSRR